MDTELVFIFPMYPSGWMLWIYGVHFLSNRISTIYLPDRKRPMLPTVLSDALCSLTENDIRFALELSLTIKEFKIIDFKFNNCVIKVKRNLRYDTDEHE